MSQSRSRSTEARQAILRDLRNWNGALEDRTLLAAQPNLSLSVPAETFIGEQFGMSVTFDNASLTDVGYGPYVTLIVPARGADGPYLGAPPDLNADGIRYVDGTATFLGTSLTPIVNQFFTGVGPTSSLSFTIPGSIVSKSVTGTVGDQLLVFQLPFGSFAPDQPPATINLTMQGSNFADLGTPLTFTASGGFILGNDPLDDAPPNGTDPDIVDTTPATATNTPVLAKLAKTYAGPENETATGPNFPRQYVITLDVATGQTLTNVHLRDFLPNSVQFISASVVGNGTTLITNVTTPSTLVPGGNLDRLLNTVVGTASAADATMTINFYVPYRDASNNIILDNTNPSYGPPRTLSNQAQDAYSWTPTDPRDGPISLDPAQTVTHSGPIARSIAIQKSVSIATDTTPTGTSPRDTLQYALDFQISDFYGHQNIVITDLFSDGQAFDTTFTPTLLINGNSYTLSAAGFGAANYTVSGTNTAFAVPNPTGPFSNPYGQGRTQIVFRVSNEIIRRGQNGQMVGGLVDMASGGHVASPGDGPTTGQILFRTRVLDQYSLEFPSGRPYVNQGDLLGNDVTIAGDNLNVQVSSTAGAFPSNGTPTITDTSSAGTSIVPSVLEKQLYAVNGQIIPIGSTPAIAPGDDVTYRLTYTMPVGSLDVLTLNDYLPLPIYDVTSLNINNYSEVKSATAPIAGTLQRGPSDTFYDITIASLGVGGYPEPTMTNERVSNILSLSFTKFDRPQGVADPSTVIDVLFTARVSSEKFADGLFLTNQARAIEGTTQNNTLIEDEINQVRLGQPVLRITKGVLTTDAAGVTYSPAQGGSLNATVPQSAGFRFTGGTVSSTYLTGSNRIDSNVSNGVATGSLVTFVLVVENTGSGKAGAFNVNIRDEIPNGFILPDQNFHARGMNLSVTDGTGAALPYVGDLFSTTGLNLLDPGATPGQADRTNAGAIDAYNATSGRNVAVITFDLQLAKDAQPEVTATNSAVIQRYTNNPTGDNLAQLTSGGTGLSDIATVVPKPFVLVKSIIASSQSFTGVAGGTERLAIGEIVRYRLQTTVPKGTTKNFVLRDNLPAELQFFNDNTARVAFVTSDPFGMYSIDRAATPGDPNSNVPLIPYTSARLATVPATPMTSTNALGYQLADKNVSSSQTTNADTYASGTDIYFKLGDIINQDTGVNQYIIVEFNALVLNTLANQTDALRSNNYNLLTESYDPSSGTSTLAGAVYVDLNSNNMRDPGEPGIAGAQVRLETMPGSIPFTPVTATTDADGRYLFVDLLPGSYKITELSAPGGYTDGAETLGSLGGTVAADEFNTINITGNQTGINYNFGETPNATATAVAGTVWLDVSRDGTLDSGETTRLAGVTITLKNSGGGTVATTTTDVNGNYAFTGIAPGSYFIEQTQPTGYGSSTANSIGTIGTPITVPVTGLINQNFGETLGTLSGYVYYDQANFGVKDAGEIGIGGVSVLLTGTNDLGDVIRLIGRTDPTGLYSFDNLRPGTYTVTESQPIGYTDGLETSGTVNGGATGTAGNTPATNDIISSVALAAGGLGINYNFGEQGVAITGTVYQDSNNNATLDPTEFNRIGGVTIELYDAMGTTLIATTYTDLNGYYEFSGAGITPGTGYQIKERTQPPTYGSSTPNTITIASLPATGLSGQNFGETLGSLGGSVYVDQNLNGVFDAGEGQQGVVIRLASTNYNFTRVTITDQNGNYTFTDLPKDSYTLTETQPLGFSDGVDVAGTSGGTAGNDVVSSIVLVAGANATGYVFQELPLNTPTSTTSNTVDARIAEPLINNLASTLTSAAPVDGGDLFTYNLTFSNTASDNNRAAAFDLRLVSNVGSNAIVQSVTFTLPSGVTQTFSGVGTSVLTVDLNQLFPTADLVGVTGVTVSVTAKVNDGVSAGTQISVDNNLFYTSLPGIGTDANATGSTVPGAAGSGTGERTGGDVTDPENNNAPTNNSILNNYAVGVDYNVTLAAPLIDMRYQGGTITADDSTVTQTTNENLAVGEAGYYDVLVTVPEGTTQSSVVVVTLPSGMKFDTTFGTGGYQIVTAAGGLLAAAYSDPAEVNTPGFALTSSDRIGTFNFADIVTTADNVTNNNSFIIRVKAIATNSAINQSGNLLRASSVLTYDPAAVGGGGSTVNDLTPNDHDFIIVEPVVRILKAVNSSAADAGDPVMYTLTIANLAANGSQMDALDVIVSDPLPADVVMLSIGTVSGVAGVTAANFQIVGQNFSTLTPFDLPLGSTLVITINGVLDFDVFSGQIINNTATTQWTSTPGSNPDERTGNPADPGGALNDYNHSSNAVVTAVAPIIVSQSIFATDQTYTPGTNVAIGEIVTYRLTVSLPEGVTNDLQLVSQLPAGLAYIPGTVMLVAAHPDPATLAAAHPGTITGEVTGGTVPTPIASPAVGAQYLDGTDVRFNFSPITITGDNNANNNTFYFTYQAVVLDVASNTGTLGAQTVLVNPSTWDITSDPDPVANGLIDPAGITATVIEPLLAINNTVVVNGAGTVGDAGDSANYTISVAHGPTSLEGAFDLTYSQPLPSQVTPGTFTVIHSTLGNISGQFEIVGNELRTIAGQNFDLAQGETLTITVNTTINDTVAPGTSLNSIAAVTYTTIDGPRTDVGNTDLITDRERTKTANDDAPFTITTPTLNKVFWSSTEPSTPNTPAPPQLTIGELGTYALIVTLSEGTTPSAVVTDQLPTGLLYTGVFSIVTSAAASNGLLGANFASTVPAPTVSGGPFSGGTDPVFTFSSIVNPGDNVANNNSFLILLETRVLNVVGNSGLTPPGQTTLPNSATLQVPSSPLASAGPVNIVVVEPSLTIDTNIVEVGVDPGDPITVTMTVSNVGTSDSFDTLVHNQLNPAQFQMGTIIFTSTPGGFTPTVDPMTGLITYTGGTIPDGGSVTFSYTITTSRTLPANTILTSTGNALGTTLPGPDPGERTTPLVTDPDTARIYTKSISGTVYRDLNNNGIINAPSETGIINVRLDLTGNDRWGNPVSRTVFTDSSGNYTFDLLTAGTYTITETHPSGFYDGIDSVGTLFGGTAAPVPGDTISNIAVPVGPDQFAVSYNFGELPPSSVAGSVYVDANNDGIRQGTETGIGGVTVTLAGTNYRGQSVLITGTTDSTGAYSFTNLPPGTYQVIETQPTRYRDGKEAAGTLGGSIAINDRVMNIVLPPATDATGYLFGEQGAAISGTVWIDINRNTFLDGSETGRISGVTITLYEVGNPVPVATTTTDTNGFYIFPNLPTGNYTIVETQPNGYGSSTTNTLNVALPTTGVTNQNFGETVSTLSGSVYVDSNNSSFRDSGEPGISGVPVRLTGTNDAGQPVTINTTTDSSGNYSFTGLLSGTYVVTEVTQPTGYGDGSDRAGSVGGTAGNDVITAITLPTATDATGYIFGELPARITGTVWIDANRDSVIDGGETGRLNGVTVTLLDNLGNVVATTTTDSSGNYAFNNLLAGTYSVVESQPSGYGSSPGSPNTIAPFALAAGGSAMHNFGETTGSLSGTVYRDDNNNGVQNGGEPPIAGVTVTLTGTNAAGQVVNLSTTTDASGNYSFTGLLAPNAGGYAITETQPANFNDGLDTLGNVGGANSMNDVFTAIPLIAGAVGAGYNFGERGTTLSGTVFIDTSRDGSLQPGETGRISGVTIELRDSGGNLVATTTTDPSGFYSFPNLPAGNYTITETQPNGYGSSSPNVLNVTLPLAGLTNQNFGETTATVSGTVYRDDNNNGAQNPGEPGIPGTTVTLTGTNILGQPVSVNTTTDASGNYSFTGLLASNGAGYTVTETQPANYNDGLDTVGSLGGVGGNDVTSTIPVAGGTIGTGYNFGERGTTVSGTVWIDTDRAGDLDPGETGRIAGVTVTLRDSSNNVVATTTTDSNGFYSFSNVPAGNYTITETQPNGYGSSTSNTISASVPLTGLTNQNFGETVSTIAGTVYRDDNNNGAQNPGEPGISGVTVTLTGTNAAGQAINVTTTTDGSGNYSFANLLSGTYTVTETQPVNYNDGLETAGSLGGNTSTNDVISAIILPVATDATNYLFGERGAGISGTVWIDTDRAGDLDPGETGRLGGVTITLLDSSGNVVATTTTDSNGFYSFPNLLPGNYTIVETQPNGYGSSTVNTLPVTLPLTGLANQNFGETTSALNGVVYRDDNNNGIQDSGEPGIPGTTVTLTGTNAAGQVVSLTTTTDASGNYSFSNLLASNGAGYTVTETQPANYNDGLDTVGTVGGSVANDVISSVVLPAGTIANGYLFGERGTTVSGTVWVDSDRAGDLDPSETGRIAGVTITLLDSNGNVVATTTTDANGNYTFNNIPVGDYTIVETQPAGYGSSTSNSLPVSVPLGGLTNQNFGETVSTLSGRVYFDRDASNSLNGGDTGISGTTVRLTGTNAAGQSVNVVTTTDASGNYSFPGLLSGTYTVTETQPTGYNDGAETAGSVGGNISVNDVISAISLPVATDATGYHFGELGTNLSGTVFIDPNKDGSLQAGETGRLGGVTIELRDSGGNLVATTTTNASGFYSFSNIPAGNYTITELQPNGYGSSSPNTLSVALPITGLTNQNFGETLASLAGSVYVDINNNGQRDPGEPGIPGASVTLSGTNALGQVVNQTVTTNNNGDYLFSNLLASNGTGYTVTETQPAGYPDGLDRVGSSGGTLGNDVLSSVVLTSGTDATGYLFGEGIPATTTADIRGTVFIDANRDGSLQPGDTGRLSGVTITLLDSNGNVVGTTTTDANGNYAFTGLTPGNYTIVETQPNGYGSSSVNTLPVTLTLAGVTGQNFGETTAEVSGIVYRDDNNNGVKNPSEPGIPGTTVTLTGTNALGQAVNLTTTTDASGNYSFTGLLASNAAGYTITETQPAAYRDGLDTAGTAGGNTSVNDLTSAVVLTPGAIESGYLFGERGASLSGTVWVDTDRAGDLDANETGRLGGVTITLLDSAGNVVATTTTDANGNYTFNNLPTGTYTIVETQPNGYGSSTSNSLTVNVPTTGLTNQNFGETVSTLAGSVYVDANNNGVRDPGELPIAGVPVTLTGTNAAGQAVSVVATTDSNGNYLFSGLLSGTYVVTETQPAAYNDGLDTAGSVGGNTATNDVISTVVLPTATDATGYLFGERGASITGTVWIDLNKDGGLQSGEPGRLGGVVIELRDNLGNVVATTTTDPDGNYSFNNLPSGNYTVVQPTQPNGYGSSTPNSVPVSLTPAGVSGINFGETLASLAGSVYVDINNDGQRGSGEPGIPGTTVTLTGTNALGQAVVLTTTTDNNGDYLFSNLLAGSYTVTETQPAGYPDGLDRVGSSGGTLGNDVLSSVVLTSGTDATGYLFGEGIPATTTADIRGTVFIDANRDGALQPGDTGRLSGVTINLRDSGGTIVATTTTDANGNYEFLNRPLGDYTIEEVQPNAYGSSSPNSLSITLTAAGVTGQNFGEVTATVSGTVFRDDDNSGAQNGGEPGIPGTTVTLTGTNALGQVVNLTTTTDASGNYSFTGLLASNGAGYTVTETQPAAYNDGLDSVGSLGGVGGNDVTTTIPVAGGVIGTGYNFGERGTTVSGTVWIDTDRAGDLDPGETGRVSGVTIELRDSLGNVVATTTTNPSGYYEFTNVPAGAYSIVETQPTGYGSSTPNTLTVNVPTGGLTNQNFGETVSTLAGSVYVDANNNGVRDPGELPIAGVPVTLTGTNAAGQAVNLTTNTDSSGNYSFTGLLASNGAGYTVTETQPAAYNDGLDTAGSVGGNTSTNDVISTVVLPTATDATGYLFGERGASITGTVWVDTNRDATLQPGETDRLGGVVIELRDNLGNLVATTTTDPAGNYSFNNLPIGDYQIVQPTQPNGYGSSTPNTLNVTLPLGGLANQNFGETVSTLSGSVYVDTNNDGFRQGGETGIQGIPVQLTGTDANGNPVVLNTSTDANGNYSFTGLLSGAYTVTEVIQPSGYPDGTDREGSVGGTAGNDVISAVSLPTGTDAVNYNFGEQTPVVTTASISGTVWIDTDRAGDLDPGETGRVSGVTITLLDSNGNVVGTTTTDANGYYEFLNRPLGSYTIVETQPTGYGSSTANTLPVTLPAGGLTNQNFGETVSTLAGVVYRDDNNSGTQNGGEPGIQGVTVTLTGTNAAGQPVSLTTTTDASGSYSFANLLSGTYTVTETQPAAYNDGLDRVGTSGGTLGNDVLSAISLPTATDATGYLFGERGTTLSGTVFIDTSRDGSLQPGETGRISGVTIELRDSGGNLVATTTTDPSGFYSFPNLPAGNYTITETQPNGYGSSSPNVLNVTLPLAGLTNQNFGETTATVSGTVYRDDNNNGAQNPGEPGIPGTTVTLTGTNILGQPVSVNTTTDASGNYSFTGLLASNGAGYTVTETQPAAYNDGLDTVGSLGGNASVNDVFSTIPVTGGAIGTGYNFGERGTTVSGTVWIDTDRAGDLDPGETGRIAGVTVTLRDSSNNVVATTTTDSNGFYSFNNVPVGTYTIVETQPNGYGSSTSNTISNVVVPLAGVTNQNFGETVSTLTGSVYVDANNDGIHQPGETGISGVPVRLTGNDANGNPVILNTTTDYSGNYTFNDLLSGTYSVTEVTQPAAYSDGLDRAGNVGGTAGNDVITTIPLPAGVDANSYTFGERGATISGTVFIDTSRDGSLQPGETGRISGVTIELRDSGGNLVATTTTDPSGFYSFPNLPAGNYTITELQPTGYGSSSSNTLNVTLPTTGLTDQNFGETTASIAGSVYIDANNDGFRVGETGIPGTSVTLSGINALGQPVNITLPTDANGNFSFDNLLSGTYTVTETQPGGYTDGIDRAGTVGGSTTVNDQISGINLNPGVQASDYLFGEQQPTSGTGSLSGTVYRDDNNNGGQNTGEPGIAGVTVELVNASNVVVQTITTDSNGNFVFENIAPGTYSIRETQPNTYVDGLDTVGTAGGSNATNDIFSSIVVNNATNGTGYLFGEQRGSTDLQVTKSNSLAQVQRGVPITYTISVTNVGNVTAKSVVLTDPLPTNTTFISASNGGTFTAGLDPTGVSPGTVNWTAFDVPANTTVTRDVTIQIGAGSGNMMRFVQTANLKTNWTTPLTLPQFNPGLGTLQSALVRNSATMNNDVKVENLSAGTSTITVNVTGTIVLASPAMPTSTTATINSPQFRYVAARYDGRMDYAGTSGFTFPSTATSGSSQQTYTTSGTLTPFIGLGTIGFTQTASAAMIRTGNGSAVVVQTYAQGMVEVIYTYLTPTTIANTASITFDTTNAFDPTPGNNSGTDSDPIVGPLKADRPASKGDGASLTAGLTTGQLAPLVNEAIQRWRRSGLRGDQLAAMRNVEFAVAPLADGYLGLTSPSENTIWIDDDAAGHGWFLDSSPRDDREFRTQTNLGRVAQGAHNPASDFMDLLTVIEHELGHVIGLDDLADPSRPGSIMTESLSPGMRRSAQAADHNHLSSNTFVASPTLRSQQSTSSRATHLLDQVLDNDNARLWPARIAQRRRGWFAR